MMALKQIITITFYHKECKCILLLKHRMKIHLTVKSTFPFYNVIIWIFSYLKWSWLILEFWKSVLYVVFLWCLLVSFKHTLPMCNRTTRYILLVKIQSKIRLSQITKIRWLSIFINVYFLIFIIYLLLYLATSKP